MHRLLTSGASAQVMAVEAAMTGLVILLQRSCLRRESGEDHRGGGEGWVGEKRACKGSPELGHSFQRHPGHAGGQGGGAMLLAARWGLVVVAVIARGCLVDCPD